jgi:hypothetical protein
MEVRSDIRISEICASSLDYRNNAAKILRGLDPMSLYL